MLPIPQMIIVGVFAFIGGMQLLRHPVIGIMLIFIAFYLEYIFRKNI